MLTLLYLFFNTVSARTNLDHSATSSVLPGFTAAARERDAMAAGYMPMGTDEWSSKGAWVRHHQTMSGKLPSQASATPRATAVTVASNQPPHHQPTASTSAAAAAPSTNTAGAAAGTAVPTHTRERSDAGAGANFAQTNQQILVASLLDESPLARADAASNTSSHTDALQHSGEDLSAAAHINLQDTLGLTDAEVHRQRANAHLTIN